MLMEESLMAIWASNMAGWCTPTVLFIVINVVVGTIFFSSSLARTSGEPNEGGGHNLTRTASALHRLKSLNSLFRQRTEETGAIDALLSTPETEVDVAEKPQGKEESHLGRSVSEGPKKVIKVEKMKKSASSKALTSSKKAVEEEEEEEEEVVVRRPATTRVAPAKDDEVDAKADDFIDRFKQQLKLQRLDSIIRYKEMINRGK